MRRVEEGERDTRAGPACWTTASGFSANGTYVRPKIGQLVAEERPATAWPVKKMGSETPASATPIDGPVEERAAACSAEIDTGGDTEDQPEHGGTDGQREGDRERGR